MELKWVIKIRVVRIDFGISPEPFYITQSCDQLWDILLYFYKLPYCIYRFNIFKFKPGILPGLSDSPRKIYLSGIRLQIPTSGKILKKEGEC